LRGCGLKAHSQKGIGPKYLGEAPKRRTPPIQAMNYFNLMDGRFEFCM